MASLRQQLVTGNQIFAQHQVLDAYGHFSVRDPERPEEFIMGRARAPELMTEADLMSFNLAGEPLRGDTRAPYSERFIHAAAYEARPEVQAVCHSHTPSIIPFGVTDMPLRPIQHLGSAIGETVPVWDIAAEFGDTNMLVVNLAQGRSLAKTLGGGTLALMRGHGCVFVGRSIPEVTRTGIYMDINARNQTTAHLLSGGKVRYLSEGEMRLRRSQPGGPPAQEPPQAAAGGGREWEAWCAQVGMLEEG